MKRLLSLLAVLVLVSACQTVQVPEGFVAKESVRLDVPQMRQYNSYSCAGHSLTMVMSYFDQELHDPMEVWDKTGSSSSVVMSLGNDMSGLRKAAKSYGFENVEFVQGMNLEELKYLLNQGKPVVINVRNFYGNSSHAVVVTGYDSESIYFNDPANGRVSLSYDDFKSKWWANMSIPRGRISKSAFIVHPKGS